MYAQIAVANTSCAVWRMRSQLGPLAQEGVVQRGWIHLRCDQGGCRLALGRGLNRHLLCVFVRQRRPAGRIQLGYRLHQLTYVGGIS